MRPAPIAFTVPLKMIDTATGEPLGPRWLGIEGEPVQSEAAAVIFQMHRSPTPRDMMRIDSRVHDLAGGLRAYIDIERSARSAQAAAIRLITAEVWPAGRPVRTDRGEAQADEAKLDAAWRASDLVEKLGFQEMQAILDRLAFLARWTVLIVDPPTGWEDIADREVPEPQLYAIMAARTAAFAEAALGKQPPSAS